jgi:predicted DNA-binding transcriptional regulator AlpA
MDLSKILRKRDVARMAGVCIRTVELLVAEGVCPAPIRLGAAVVFDEDEVRRWLHTYRRYQPRKRSADKAAG